MKLRPPRKLCGVCTSSPGRQTQSADHGSEAGLRGVIGPALLRDNDYAAVWLGRSYDRLVSRHDGEDERRFTRELGSRGNAEMKSRAAKRSAP